jgi:hypothetical protein
MSAIKIDKFDQIGIIVKDIEKSAEIYQSYFNFKGPINIVEQWSDVEYKGKNVRFKMKKIMQTINHIQLEIVEVLESTGEHLYSDFIKEGNQGLHHLGIYTKNAEEIINQFKINYKIDVIQDGKAGKVNFFYLDTKTLLGYYLELISF